MYMPGNFYSSMLSGEMKKFPLSMEIAINMIVKLHILQCSFLGNGDTSRNLSIKIKCTNGMKIKTFLMVKDNVYLLDVFHLPLGFGFFSNFFSL